MISGNILIKTNLIVNPNFNTGHLNFLINRDCSQNKIILAEINC